MGSVGGHADAKASSATRKTQASVLTDQTFEVRFINMMVSKTRLDFGPSVKMTAGRTESCQDEDLADNTY
ncbi:hypothetical protein CRENBAI_017799 [Crenichthys baileyi]|uniref:Uncharacterized protein n=1 Tax=Crenichthys baileyi TaxID=28760 RepID=A0AAV9SP37_9TELE